MWNTQGGFEVYNNEFHGGDTDIDIAGDFNYKGSYPYSWYIHDNLFISDYSSSYQNKIGIDIENQLVEDVLVYRNRFVHKHAPFNITNGNDANVLIQRIYFAYNIMEGCGRNVAGDYKIVVNFHIPSDMTLQYFYFYNNIFIGDGVSYLTGFYIENAGKANNLYFRNNIITNFTHPVQAWLYVNNTGTMDGLYVDNNILYNNANNSDLIFTGNSVSNYEFSNNQKVNPLFVSSMDFHLQAASPAIGKGLSLAGLTTDFEGKTLNNPPSIGAYESGSTATTPAIPVYQKSVVANATPSLLAMTYSLALANVVPVASSFSVRINSVVRTVTAVAISGTQVQLTLASPIISGNIVTVTYTIPASNPLQTISGGQAIAISGQPVTNNINSINPVYVSSAIENVAPSLLAMTYNLALANIVPVASAFSVSVNSVTRTVTTIAVSGTKVQLTLASPIVSSDVVTVTYTKPATNPLQTASGGTVASISNQAVMNNRINVAPAAVITSPVTNSSFTALSSITITANALDADGSVSIVEFYGGNTRLGSKSAAPYSFTWNNVAAGTYSLSAIATDNLNTKTTSPAISISVINGKPGTNRHPIVKISNPRKGIVFDNLSTITIDAIASDPDGTVNKVEFFNGTVRLVELTSAPYTYTWKDVAAGSYSITAIATDNLNDTTVSTSVEFVVGAKVKYDANSDIVKLYPNPNDGHFSIEFLNPLQNEKSEIVITDLAGKQIYNGPILKEETLKQFDLSSSKSGIYVMLIKDKEILVTKKFIKN